MNFVNSKFYVISGTEKKAFCYDDEGDLIEKIDLNEAIKSFDEKIFTHVMCFNKPNKKAENQGTNFEKLKNKSMKRIEQKKQQKNEISKKNAKKYFWEGDLIYTIDMNDEVYLNYMPRRVKVDQRWPI